MKSEYMYCIKMPGIGLLPKTMALSEKEAIKAFNLFEPRLTWNEALDAKYRCVKVIVTELR